MSDSIARAEKALETMATGVSEIQDDVKDLKAGLAALKEQLASSGLDLARLDALAAKAEALSIKVGDVAALHSPAPPPPPTEV